MSSINNISVEKLARLLGTPKCPDLVDVRTDEDFARSPHLLPGAIRRPYNDVSGWADDLRTGIGVLQLDHVVSSEPWLKGKCMEGQ